MADKRPDTPEEALARRIAREEAVGFKGVLLIVVVLVAIPMFVFNYAGEWKQRSANIRACERSDVQRAQILTNTNQLHGFMGDAEHTRREEAKLDGEGPKGPNNVAADTYLERKRAEAASRKRFIEAFAPVADFSTENPVDTNCDEVYPKPWPFG